MPVQTLPEDKAPRAEFRAEILQTLIARAPAAMHYAKQYGLCPAEIRAIVYEALLHVIGRLREPGPGLPILAKPPAELCCKSAMELYTLLGDYSCYQRAREC